MTSTPRPPEYRRLGTFELVVQDLDVTAHARRCLVVAVRMDYRQTLEAMRILMDGLIEAYGNHELARSIVAKHLGIKVVA